MSGVNPIVVGVLNVTPDSFSDGGRYFDSARAKAKALSLRELGAHFVEIGGESTRPGSLPVLEEEEVRRVLPLVKALAPQMPLAVDTFRSSTARLCLEAGATLINDVSALRFDPAMAECLASFECSVVIMHSKEGGAAPHATEQIREYEDVIAELVRFFDERVTFATSKGIKEENIILDPGLGKFLSHSADYSWEVIERISEFVKKVSPHRVFLGASRKGFLDVPSRVRQHIECSYLAREGEALEHPRDLLSAQVNRYAIDQGVHYIRTHSPERLRNVSTLSRSEGRSTRP